MSRRVAIYADTNVLYPYYMSDLLLWLASNEVIRLIWTQYLIDEVLDVVPRRRLSRGIGRDHEAVRRQWAAAQAHLRRDEVSEADWRSMLHMAVGPDPDDYPHQAAALWAGVDFLLTHDATGFPVAPLRSIGITVIGTDEFLCHLLATQEEDVLATLRLRARSFNRPPMTFEEYLNLLAMSAPEFASSVARAASVPIPHMARARTDVRHLLHRRAPKRRPTGGD